MGVLGHKQGLGGDPDWSCSKTMKACECPQHPNTKLWTIPPIPFFFPNTIYAMNFSLLLLSPFAITLNVCLSQTPVSAPHIQCQTLHPVTISSSYSQYAPGWFCVPTHCNSQSHQSPDKSFSSYSSSSTSPDSLCQQNLFSAFLPSVFSCIQIRACSIISRQDGIFAYCNC